MRSGTGARPGTTARHAACDTARVGRVQARGVLNDGEGAGVGEHVAGNLRPVDDPSGIAGELVEEDVLTPGVHIPEWMDRCRLAPYPGQPLRELVSVERAQPVTPGEDTEDALGLGHDELRAAVRDTGTAGVGVGVAYLTAPRVHILRQIGVNRLQVRKVVPAEDRMLTQGTHAGANEVDLGVFPIVIAGDAELVDENVAARIGIPIRHRDAIRFRRCGRPGVRGCERRSLRRPRLR